MMRIIAFFAVIVLANASGLYSLGELSSYGLGDGSLSRQEIRTPDGIVRGTLTYIDGDGKIKSVTYGGDNDDQAQKVPAAPMEGQGEGDREQSQQQEQQQQDDSSKPAEEMKEEGAADASENNQNQKAEDNGSSSSSPAQPQPAADLPQPVAYTPEVAAARAAHFAARDQAIYLQQLAANQQQLEANQQQLLNQQQILEYPPIFREYYGAAKPLRTLNPYYYL